MKMCNKNLYLSRVSVLALIVISMLLVGTSHMAARSFDYDFANLGIDDGLSANHVKAIVRDREGFVWIGTVNGLNRYDGVSIRTYVCYDNEKRKGNNNIGALYEGHDGIIWIGTDRGVYTYTPEKDRIDYIDIWDDATYGLNWVQRITGDSKDNIWILVPDQGIFRKSAEEYRRYELPPGSKFKEVYFNDICMSPQDVLWACSSNGKVFRHDKGYDEMVEVNFNLPEGLRLARILPIDNDKLLLASENGRIWLLEPDHNYAATEISVGLPDNMYLRSVAVADREIWVATQNGLYVYDRSNGSKSHFVRSLSNPSSISDNTVYTLYTDSEENIWLGTVFGGVDYTVRDSFHFSTIEPIEPDSRRVRGLALTDDNKLVVLGSVSNGISILNLNDDRFLDVPSPLNAKIPVMCVAASDDRVLVGPDREGLWVLDPGRKPYQYLPGQLSKENTVYAYLKDSRGDEWIGLSYALYRRSYGHENFERVEETEYKWIFALHEASDGTVWIGTMGSGLYHYFPDGNKFDFYFHDEHNYNPAYLRSNSINSITEDRNGRIWISTDRGGLSRYNPKTNDFTTFGVKEGLPDNVVYPVVEDRNGYLWFGTNRGLVRMDTTGNHIVVYTKTDGLPSNEFTYNSAISAGDSVLIFGTSNGLVRFNPNNLKPAVGEYPLLFTSILLHEDGQDKVRSLDNILYLPEIRLPYDFNTFSLSVGVPSATTMKGTKRFFYRLLPMGEKWIPMHGNTISFTNLAPSTYILEVKMECGDMATFNKIKIRVLPPWWRSVWAIILYILLLIAAIILLFMMYRRRELKRLKEQQEIFASNKEKEVYRQKLNFFTEIAHEIRTPLSLIDLPLEAMQENGLNHPQSEHYLKVTRQNTTRLLELTSQLLDFQKIEAGRLRLKPEAVDITELVSFTLDRFEPAISLRDKRLVRMIPKESLVTVTDKEALTKIISNLLNNAMKYAASDITVAVETSGDILRIKVASDGDIIPVKEREKIFETFYQTDKSQEQKNGVGIGLPLSRSLAELLGGALDLSVEPDDAGLKGNIFVVSLPLKANIQPVVPAIDNTPASSIVYEEESNQTPLRAEGYHVLLVEDNEGIRSMLSERLSSAFLLSMAANGKEALEILEKKSVDIVVTDIMMPEMDGLELCRRIKDNPDLSHIPVVFITAKNDLDSKVKGLQFGAEAYIEKPFSIKYLREMVVTLLENRRRAREAFAKKPFFEAENIPVNKEDEKFMEKVIKLIKENMGDENFNVETLGDLLCMSRSNMFRHIKGVFNLSPSELIRVVRLKRAAELIRGGGYTLGEISNMIGISSQSYFTKLFFKQFNIMPNEFARQVASQREDSGK